MTKPVQRPWATNPGAGSWIAPGVRESALEFHRSMPGYAATPLIEVPALAELLGAGSVWVKDESNRFGLPAFKVLGASWAVNRALGPARTFAELVSLVAGRRLTLVTATDGNHGRALAYLARALGLRSRIYVPAGLPEAPVQAIRDEGASVVDTGLPYDDAVQAAAASVRDGDVLIQDTAWPGYEEVPRWIVAGYSTLFAEIDGQLPSEIGLVVVPTGVGSLLQSAIEHYRVAGRRTSVLAVEPVTAACVTKSLAAGRPVTVDTSAPTIMAGLNCGTVSSTAWPTIHRGLDAAIAVTDDETRAAQALLHSYNIPAGPCGAAALAALQVTDSRPSPDAVVLINTEGATAQPAATLGASIAQ
ncbi:pyridoxal-phosphate dependent enzyme [Kribbella soli]|uniref:Pyridoxal-phosphate dependent enzyme n=1 Tax=Kribbella soli TaxID=1124743 RepID=A0A4R0GWW2_9ACTN|nr:pyridoxal-phosphate dependent enzyme [Kribbella soli]TCC01603.1 pyridoxal-phosphate dependent enzyme [Kribbella soli]